MPLTDNLTILASLIDASIADLSKVAWCSLTQRSLSRLLAAANVVREMGYADPEEYAEQMASCEPAEWEDAPF